MLLCSGAFSQNSQETSLPQQKRTGKQKINTYSLLAEAGNQHFSDSASADFYVSKTTAQREDTLSHQVDQRDTSGLLWVLSVLLLLLGGGAYWSRHRLSRFNRELKVTNKQLLEENKQAHNSKQKYEAELQDKNRQLASHTLHVIQKNQVLLELGVVLNELRQQKSMKEAKKRLNSLDNLANYGINLDRDWKCFQEVFEQLHPEFYSKLKATYPELTRADLHLCALLRLNMTTKEIAGLQNITPKSANMKRYRLRQKMRLDSDDRLFEVIIMFDSNNSSLPKENELVC